MNTETNKDSMKKQHAARVLKTGLLMSSGALLSTTGDLSAAVVYSGLLNKTIASGSSPKITVATPSSGFKLRQSAGMGIVGPFGYPVYFANSGPEVGMKAVIKQNASDSITAAKGVSWDYNGALFEHQGGGVFNTNFNFNDTTPGYAAFHLYKRDGDPYKYGWMYIDSIATDGSSFVLRDWAYEDTGGAINVGQKSDGGSAVPEPSALALLACGLAGVFAMRRKCRQNDEK